MKQIISISRWPTAFILGGLMFFASCKKDNSTQVNTPGQDSTSSVEVAQNEAGVSSQFDDVFDITMGVQASDAGEDIGLGTGTDIMYRGQGTDSSTKCYTVTVVPDIPHQFPKTVTIDFGSGCLGKDGKLRSGKIVTIFTGPMKISGSKASATFINYTVDSFQVAGTYTVQNTSSSNKQAWTIAVIDGKISNTSSGRWVEWNATHERKLIKGNGTPDYNGDNVLQITGNSNGSNSNGRIWSSIITDPVIRKGGCKWRVKGQVQITRKSNTHIALLDYGDGTCDNIATITVNGVTRTITLPR